jgi:hypothetical protein
VLPQRLTTIDESNRAAHHFLDADDHCYFFGEFFSGRGYEGGATNQLILNLKIAPSKLSARPSREKYKSNAIDEVARALRAAIPERQVRESLTFVPIPPVKGRRHAGLL